MHEGISDKNIETSWKGMILDYIAISSGDGDRQNKWGWEFEKNRSFRTTAKEK